MTRFLKPVLGALTLAMLAFGSAAAQTPNINLMPELQSKTPEEIERDQKREKAYKESLKQIPDAKVSDPWGTVRTGEAAKSPPPRPKSAPVKRAKADGTAN